MAFTLHLHTDLDSAVQTVTEALKSEGFGVLTEIDVTSTFKEKLEVDYHPYKILGACNPNLAYNALQANDKVGTLLPCNVTLSEDKPGTVTVTIIDPKQMLSIFDDNSIEEIAKEAREKLQRVHQQLQQLHT